MAVVLTASWNWYLDQLTLSTKRLIQAYLQEFADRIADASTPTDSTDQACELMTVLACFMIPTWKGTYIVVHDDHITGFLSNLRSGYTHREADIRLL